MSLLLGGLLPMATSHDGHAQVHWARGDGYGLTLFGTTPSQESESPTLRWEALSTDAPPIAERSLPQADSRVGDPAATLSAWLPGRIFTASLTLRESRSGTLAVLERIQAGGGTIWLAALVAALTLRSPLRSTIGPGSVRPLRGPPARALAT